MNCWILDKTLSIAVTPAVHNKLWSRLTSPRHQKHSSEQTRPLTRQLYNPYIPPCLVLLQDVLLRNETFPLCKQERLKFGRSEPEGYVLNYPFYSLIPFLQLDASFDFEVALFKLVCALCTYRMIGKDERQDETKVCK